jgi:hypothetical protein
MTDDLMDRFDDAEGTASDGDDQSDDEDSETVSASSGSTRSRSQYPMYLSEQLQEELDDRFNKFNARRELDDKQQVEKHKHFLQGLIRSALDQNGFEEFVEEEFERDS